MMEMLLHAGADDTADEPQGGTPLQRAVSCTSNFLDAHGLIPVYHLPLLLHLTITRDRIGFAFINRFCDSAAATSSGFVLPNRHQHRHMPLPLLQPLPYASSAVTGLFRVTTTCCLSTSSRALTTPTAAVCLPQTSLPSEGVVHRYYLQYHLPLHHISAYHL